ncbi:MAG: hypothetical protein ACH36H_01135 [Candidatus Nanopelagicales bacterium]
MADPDAPWWSADDEEFAGATPIFGGESEGAAAPDGASADEDTAEDSRARAGDQQPVGTAIGEALKFAAALTAWSEQSGLTDTLKTIAAEAAEALNDPAAEAAPTVAPVFDAHSTVVVCDYCPVCRGMDVLRQVQPHLAQGLAEAMSSLTQALNLAVDSFAASQHRSAQ